MCIQGRPLKLNIQNAKFCIKKIVVFNFVKKKYAHRLNRTRAQKIIIEIASALTYCAIQNIHFYIF